MYFVPDRHPVGHSPEVGRKVAEPDYCRICRPARCRGPVRPTCRSASTRLGCRQAVAVDSSQLPSLYCCATSVEAPTRRCGGQSRLGAGCGLKSLSACTARPKHGRSCLRRASSVSRCVRLITEHGERHTERAYGTSKVTSKLAPLLRQTKDQRCGESLV